MCVLQLGDGIHSGLRSSVRSQGTAFVSLFNACSNLFPTITEPSSATPQFIARAFHLPALQPPSCSSSLLLPPPLGPNSHAPYLPAPFRQDINPPPPSFLTPRTNHALNEPHQTILFASFPSNAQNFLSNQPTNSLLDPLHTRDSSAREMREGEGKEREEEDTATCNTERQLHVFANPHSLAER